ncbi:MAG: phosphatidylserine decarboxylase family protein [Prolixibacteraceae bacterium]|jgi:phosphatidylserine decarboxylase|nr:phosphatidylserine decarboxylase family protein [Prolixibacteraceae bacterium]
MRVHKEGRISLLIIAVFIVSVNYILIKYIRNEYFIYPAIVLSATLYLFAFYFFRVVNRPVINDSNAIIAPCDGKVVVIENIQENTHLNEEVTQISIFMSPLNVHMNWFPVSGKILHAQREKGSHTVAWAPKASTHNERSIVLIETENKNKILVKQIAGAVARRVVCYAKTGKYADQNGNLGFIKFGSRVDLFLPKSANIKVELNQKVIGTQTVIARFN